MMGSVSSVYIQINDEIQHRKKKNSKMSLLFLLSSRGGSFLISVIAFALLCHLYAWECMVWEHLCIITIENCFFLEIWVKSQLGVQVKDQLLFINNNFTAGITAWDYSYRRFTKLEEEILQSYLDVIIDQLFWNSPS